MRGSGSRWACRGRRSTEPAAARALESSIVPDSFTFSPDGKHFVYVAGVTTYSVPRAPFRVVVDGLKGEYHDAVPDAVTFQADGTLEYLATKGKTAYRLRRTPDSWLRHCVARSAPRPGLSQESGVARPLEPAMPSPFRAGSRDPRYGGSPGGAGADRRLQLTANIASPELP